MWWLSLAAASKGIGWLLVAVTFLLCCRAWATGHEGFSSWGDGLSCPVACGVLLEQRLNLCSPHWQADPQPLGLQGSSQHIFFRGYNSTPSNCNSLDTFYVFRIMLRVLTVESYLITPTTLPARLYYHPNFTHRDPDAQRAPTAS